MDQQPTLRSAETKLPVVELIEIAVIEMNGGTQPRTYTAREYYARYAERMLEGDTFPPVVVFTDESKTHWLADGFHRVRGRLQSHAVLQEQSSTPLPPPTILAEIRHAPPGQTGQRAAVLHACGANHDHGIPRTTEDMRLAVDRLVKDPEWTDWADRQIAAWCHVGRTFVRTRRQELAPRAPSGRDGQMQALASVRTVERGGTTYVQDTSRIAEANRARAAASPVGSDDDPLAGAAGHDRMAGHDRVAGHREPEQRDRGLHVENTINAVIRSIAGLPTPDQAARLARGLDHDRVRAAAGWLGDFYEELQDRSDRGLAR